MKKTVASQKLAQGLLMRVGGTTKEVTSARRHWALPEIQKLVGGYFEIVRIPGVTDRIMLVDEDGRPKALKPNPNASELAGRLIVGDVLVVRRKDIN